MENERNDLSYWLALWHVPGIGPKSFAKAIARYPHLQDLFSCTATQLRQFGFNEKSMALPEFPWCCLKIRQTSVEFRRISKAYTMQF